jgi:hypothetical protein
LVIGLANQPTSHSTHALTTRCETDERPDLATSSLQNTTEVARTARARPCHTWPCAYPSESRLSVLLTSRCIQRSSSPTQGHGSTTASSDSTLVSCSFFHTQIDRYLFRVCLRPCIRAVLSLDCSAVRACRSVQLSPDKTRSLPLSTPPAACSLTHTMVRPCRFSSHSPHKVIMAGMMRLLRKKKVYSEFAEPASLVDAVAPETPDCAKSDSDKSSDTASSDGGCLPDVSPADSGAAHSSSESGGENNEQQKPAVEQVAVGVVDGGVFGKDLEGLPDTAFVQVRAVLITKRDSLAQSLPAYHSHACSVLREQQPHFLMRAMYCERHESGCFALTVLETTRVVVPLTHRRAHSWLHTHSPTRRYTNVCTHSRSVSSRFLVCCTTSRRGCESTGQWSLLGCSARVGGRPEYR